MSDKKQVQAQGSATATRQSSIDLAASNPQHHQIISWILDEDRGDATVMAHQLSRMTPDTVDRLEFFLKNHLLQLRRDAHRSLTATFQSTAFHLLDAWVSDLENHFDSLHAVFGNRLSHHSFEVLMALTYYRSSTHLDLISSMEQEVALLRFLSWSSSTPSSRLHYKRVVESAVVLKDEDLFKLVISHPQSVEDIIQFIESNGYSRAAPLEMHLTVSPNSPLNEGAL